MVMNSTALAAELKTAIITELGIDLTDPHVIEATAEANIEKLAKAIAEKVVLHIQTYATITFVPGTVTGVCPSGGGALTSGAGTNGSIA